MSIKYDRETFNAINQIMKDKIALLQHDYEKLKGVDALIGEDATDAKKHDLLNSVFCIQDIQSKAMDELFDSVSHLTDN